MDMLHQSSDPKASADLAVVLMQEGVAYIFLIGKSKTRTCFHKKIPIPRKHGPAIAGYDKAMNEFFDEVFQAFVRHVDFNVVRCAVIASPGFTKDQFHKHLMLEAARKQIRPLIENRSRIILVHTTSRYKYYHLTIYIYVLSLALTFFPNCIKIVLCEHKVLKIKVCIVYPKLIFQIDFVSLNSWEGYILSRTHQASQVIQHYSVENCRRHSLREVLGAPNIMNMIKDTKAAQEVRALKDFFSMFSNDAARACYGPKHVEVAQSRKAVQTLLVTDELFKCSDIPTRKKYINLVESVKTLGGKAYIFSSKHVSGEHLAQLTGIAAILHFPLPDLDDLEM